MIMQHKIKNIHFVGIGGAGMSGIAEVLHNLGYKIRGSDIAISNSTDHLIQLGITIFMGHKIENLAYIPDVLVISSAIDRDNPEIVQALNLNIPIVPRAMMLAELMRFQSGIAIAGTHGKTTTTSMCADVLRECGFDPTFVIGGRLATTGTNAKLGNGEYLVAEADESDASFLYLNPMIAVVTNIDLDHMETYDHDENKLHQAFIDFIHRIPFYGRVILCADDPRIKLILDKIKRPITLYGLDSGCDLYASEIKNLAGQMSYKLNFKSSTVSYEVILNTIGIHNVLNSLAVVAVALECGGKIDDILYGLADFKGVGRRVQKYGNFQYQNKNFMLIDDYAHHPKEIAVTVNALTQAYPQKRLVLVFQPHRYTRTLDLFDDFVQALSTITNLILLEIYSAGELAINKINSKTLIKAIRINAKTNPIYASNIIEAKTKIFNFLEDDDLLVTMGAGNIAQLAKLIIEDL